MASVEAISTPEGESKELVEQEYRLIAAQSEHFGWECRLEDAGDYDIVSVRIVRPEGRTFVLRLECDDYSRQAPLATFANPKGWDDPELKDDVQPEFWPTGGSYLSPRGKAHPAMCIRGQREYYEGNWHAGWTNPPARQDRIYELVVNIRHAILDHWA
jgi:hypothetical protein